MFSKCYSLGDVFQYQQSILWTPTEYPAIQHNSDTIYLMLEFSIRLYRYKDSVPQDNPHFKCQL